MNSDGDLRRLALKAATAANQEDTPSLTNFLANVGGMDELERSLFFRILEEMRGHGFSDSWKSIWQIDYERQPIPFTEWCEDPYYMGPEFDKNLYPTWKKELAYVLHPANGVVEWYITGAIGGGKTYASLIAQLYKLYVASCLKDPQRYYGIASNTEMVFGLFNTVLANALTVNFNQAARFVNQSGYFRDHCPANIQRTKMIFPTKNIMMRMGSTELHALGSNLLSFMIDEVNFMAKPMEKEEEEHQAFQIYTATARRLKSRYLDEGLNPGLACIVSSRRDQSAFLEGLMKDNKNNPQVHISDYAVWETKGRHRYSPVEFRVAVGNRYQRSEMLNDLEIPQVAGIRQADFKNAKVIRTKPTPAGMDWVAVPADFYYDFLRDIEGALRDIAGVATFGEKPLIWRVESVTECIDPNRIHPFTSEWCELSMDDPLSDLVHHVRWDQLVTVRNGAYESLYFPGEPRFVHVDFGLTKDCSGIAVGCSYDKYVITERDPATGQTWDIFRPKVWIDMMLQIKPARGEQIDLEKIVDFILNLRNYGFNLQRVTFDGFASEMAIQKVQKANLVPDRKRQAYRSGRFNEKMDIESMKISVDRDDVPYRMLRDALNCRAVKYYSYPIWENEVLGLEHDVDGKGGRGKVDHPEGGSKDVADAVCGVNYSICTSKQGYPSDPVDGIMNSGEDPTIETTMIKDIVSDYAAASRIEAIMPPPKPEPKSRKLYTGRNTWMKELSRQFGRNKL
jgi:hypothetical protein